jgi:hypothetical protein
MSDETRTTQGAPQVVPVSATGGVAPVATVDAPSGEEVEKNYGDGLVASVAPGPSRLAPWRWAVMKDDSMLSFGFAMDKIDAERIAEAAAGGYR